MEFHLYILYSSVSDRFYVGHTGEDVNERLRKHLSNHNGYTSKVKDWVIAYVEQYSTKDEAYRREMEIKGWKSKRMIQQLLNTHSSAGSEHPDL